MRRFLDTSSSCVTTCRSTWLPTHHVFLCLPVCREGVVKLSCGVPERLRNMSETESLRDARSLDAHSRSRVILRVFCVCAGNRNHGFRCIMRMPDRPAQADPPVGASPLCACFQVNLLPLSCQCLKSCTSLLCACPDKCLNWGAVPGIRAASWMFVDLSNIFVRKIC